MKYSFDEVVLYSRTGLNPRQNFKLGQGTNKYITIKNFHNNQLIVDENTDVVDDDAIRLIHKRSQIKKGDILFASIGRIGDCYIIEDDPVDWDINESVFCFTLDTHIISQKYFYYFFKNQTAIDYLTRNSSGSTFKSIKMNQLKKMVFDLPSLSEQSTIIASLDSVTAIIELRQQQLQQLDELIKARFVELFGDPIDNTKKMPVEQFSRCCLDMHQGINTVADKVEYQSVGYPIIQSKNITKGYLDLLDVRYLTDEDYLKYHEKYNPKVNDMLICNIGTIGKSLIIKEEQDFLIAWNLFLVKLNIEKVNPDYIKVFVEFLNDRHYYDQFLTGGTVKFVNKKTMGNIPAILPPMELQNQFADFVKQVDKSKVAAHKALEEAQLLFDSLMQKYFG